MQFAFEKIVDGEQVVETYSDENQENFRIMFNTNHRENFDIFHKNQTGLGIGRIVKHSVNLKNRQIINCSNAEYYTMILVLKEPESLEKSIR